MLGSSKGFAGFAVKDMPAAKQYYTDVLGLKVSEEPMGVMGLQFDDGNTVMVYPKDDHEPATYTVLNFPVDDLDAAVDGLAAKGVTFERYDGFEQDEKGIAGGGDNGPRIAWFTDLDGNIFAVMQA